MTFADRLAAGRFAVALEITPPQKPLAAVLLRRARLLGPRAHAINVIQRPDRQSSLEASCTLREAGIEPAWHLVTRGNTRDTLRADIARASAAGLRQVLCIRGDHPGPDSPDTPALREVVALTLTSLPGALVGATFNQYAPDQDAALRNLLGKLRAGAAYVQTQPVFDADAFTPAAETILDRAPDTKIIPMIMPLVSPDEALRIQDRLHIRLPGSFLSRLETEECAWQAFAEIAARLRESSAVSGIAIMTLGMDPAPEIGAQILRALDAASIADD
ncbi:MAG: methylenetetrahydrofolate reductase [Dehalococcoidia bacterium]|nr:methylenetetrahydrofolate reductase [Dehalococcoidia bacterium]